jgi:hypothetical protein
MFRSVTLALVCLDCLLLAACSTIESRMKEQPAVFASLSPQDQALVQAGRIREGMSKADTGIIRSGVLMVTHTEKILFLLRCLIKTAFFEGDRCTGWEYVH